MAEKLQNLLHEVGSKLENPPANKDALIKLLKQAASSLSEIEQSPPKAVLESMQPFVNAIVKPELLKHHDKEVKLLVATCTCEITRVTAPEAPYDDDILKDIFRLIVSTFIGLKDTKGPSFGRRVTILETVAKYRSCIVMLDLECDDLVNEMFRTFFAVASDEHSESVITSMKTIMVVLLEESEDINIDLLLIILSVLGRDKKAISMAARKLAMNVIGQCAGKLESGIKQFIVKSMSGDENSSSFAQIDYHEVIYDIYRCAPQALAGIVPYLSGELLTDKLEVRSKAVKLVGDLFSIPNCIIPETFHPIFLEFLRRLTDRVVEIRLLVLEHIKLCMLSNPYRPESPQLIGSLCERLLDYDENIRQKVVGVVCDIACHELASIPLDTIKLVADRLRDKSLPVKKYTMERLCDIYRKCCSDTMKDEYDWIPGRILRCFYDKDFRSDTVEYVLSAALFPANFSVRDKVLTWVRLFSKFDKVEVKALEKILEQKQRLQLELRKYLSLRQMYKENGGSEIQKKVRICFRIMSQCFMDPTKAESDFPILHQLKDANVWKMLTTLLDPSLTSLQTCKYQDELLKIVGKKHPLYGFLSTLSMKCSYILFNKDYIKDILLEVKSSGNKLQTQSCMNILVILASFSPLLLSGTEKDLVHLLEDDNEVIKEGVLHVLAKAGGIIHGESSSNLGLILENICLEGGRRQARYAVLALAAITKDDGLKSLSVLYKKLVDMLEKKTHLPAVLQSLGCIAQIAMPVFETQETKIQKFIKKDILGCSEEITDETKESWNDRTDLCSLKIYGIKTLVKSYLGVKDAHLRVGIDDLIKDLANILTFGEISKDIESSGLNKAHLKLASAKAILRLSKHWDKNIPLDVFYLTLTTSEVGFPQARKLFLNKVHQYIKDRSLDPKYACAFLLGFESNQSVEENRNLNDIIQMSQQGKAIVHPEYILPYLIHAISHHPKFPNIDECKDVKAYEPIYRKLYLFFNMLAIGDEDGKPGKSLKKEEVISVLSVLQSIRSSEDVVDTKKSKSSYAVCDLCFSIINRLAQKQEHLQEPLVHVSLPQMLYKPHDKKEEDKIQEDFKVENNKVEDKKEEDKEKENKHVNEGQTWLADDSVVSHFQLLNMEVNETIEDDLLKDSEETDGNELPLGKIIKRLKAKGAKERKMSLENGSATQNNKNNSILGTVKEINLDILGVSNKFDIHEKTKNDEKPKRKRIPTEKMAYSVQKSQKSKELSAFDNIIMSDQNIISELDEKDHIQTQENENINLQKHKKLGPVMKRKRASVAGLAKCTPKEEGLHTTDLIGRRIKVWWPMDGEFYEGLVKSYDHQKKKHVVLYNDGDVEVIRLDKEQWELIANTPKPKKRNRLSKSPRPKKGSRKKKSEALDNSKKNMESIDISPLRGERTKKRRKTVTRSLEYMEEKRKQKSESEPDYDHEHATFSKVANLDSEESDREEVEDAESSDPENVEESTSEKCYEDDAELDDMPLGVWKSQVRKADKANNDI